MIACLTPEMRDGALRLVAMAPAHREPIRSACAEDAAIWPIYFRSFLGDAFDASFDALLDDPVRAPFAMLLDDVVIGMSSFCDVSVAHRRLEIGSTYLAPRHRGTGLNARAKRLMLRRAFACGIERVEFKVDVRNARSQAAMAKTGAVREGVARRHMVTWTGHVRDSVIFSILRDEWPG